MLPIGSIVYLVNGVKKMMIMNIGPVIKKDEEQIYFDYSGSIYPEGLDSKKIYYFNQEDVSEVVFEGYQDEDGKRFGELYERWVEDNQDYMSRGEVK